MIKKHRVPTADLVIGKKKIAQFRIAHRNDECPCGKSTIVQYKDAKGVVFKEEPQRNKFKNCCLDKQLEPVGHIKSSEELLKQKRQTVGWPMRDYLAKPASERFFIPQGNGAKDLTVSFNAGGNNNRKFSSGRPVISMHREHILGFTVKVLEGSPAYKSHLAFRAYVEVKAPDMKDLPKPSRKRKLEKLFRWKQAVADAWDKADRIAEDQHFKCVVIPKVERSSKRIRLNS